MAEYVCRVLRDGALEGEYAPALTIKDTVHSPLGHHVFNHVLAQLSTNVLASKSQSRGIVLVALSRSPSFYAELLKSRVSDVASSHQCVKVLDCYTDPLGWKSRLMEHGRINNLSPETFLSAKLCTDIKDLDRLLSSIIELGKELVGDNKGRFAVAIDSVSELLRHMAISSVAGTLSNLRSHGWMEYGSKMGNEINIREAESDLTP